MNKKGSIHPVTLGFFVFGTIAFMIFLLSSAGKITYERPYWAEYKTCQKNLDDCSSTQLKACPAVKCTQSSFIMFMSSVMLIGSFFVYIMAILFYKNQDKSLTAREDKLAKDREDLRKDARAVQAVKTEYENKVMRKRK